MNQQHKSRWEEFLRFLRDMWPAWSILISVALGLISVLEFMKSGVLPPVYAGYLGLGFVLVGAVIAIALLYRRNLKLQRGLTELGSYPSLFIEGVPVQSVIAHIERRRRTVTLNPVQLDVFEINCRIVGEGTRKDADVRYYFKGTSTSPVPLRGLFLSIAGDHLVPLEQLNCRCYDLTHDPKKRVPLVPRLVGSDTTRKDLFLPFLTPGIEPYKSFELELCYVWPAIFAGTEDYWFLDNIDFEGRTRKVILSVEFVSLKPESVRVYALGPRLESPEFLGALAPMEDNPRKYVFERDNPRMGTYYILLFEACQELLASKTKRVDSITSHLRGEETLALRAIASPSPFSSN